MMRRSLSLLLACLLTWPVSGWAQSRTFGGVSTDKVAIGNYAAINDLTTFSLSIWSYRTGSGGSSVGRMLDKRNANANGSFFLYTTNAGFETFEFHRWGTTEGQWTWTTPSDSVWHETCVTYDAGATTNDPLVRVDDVNQTLTEVTSPTGTLQSETETLNIGNRNDNARNWDGRLAHAAIWNVVLTVAECGALFRGVSPLLIRPAALVLYMPTLGLASPEPNRASSANTGTVTGTVLNTAGPPVGFGRGAMTGVGHE